MSQPRLRAGRRLRGANVHHRAAVFVQRVELGPLDGLHAGDLGPEFAARFVARFADLQSLPLWPCLDADVIAALEGGRDVPLAELLLQAALAVERAVACIMRRMDPLAFARVVRPADAPGAADLVWESRSTTLSRGAVKVAFTGLLELLPRDRGGRSFDSARDFAARWDKLRRRALRRQWAPATTVLALAARHRGIRHEVLAGNYVRLGEGVLQQVVAEPALGAGPHGTAVAVPDVKTPPPSWKFGRQRLHRLLVLRARVVAAVRIDPPLLTGDGAATIAELIKQVNRQPQRDGGGRARIAIAAPLRAHLAEQDLHLDDVLPRGRKLRLECVTTIEHGALPVDVTEQMHDDVRHAAMLAAAEHGMPNAAVDFRTANISRSPRGGRGRVTRIDPRPELFLHALPGLGRSVEVGYATLDAVFPRRATGRIPSALIVGQRGTMALARWLDRYLRASHTGVGLALGDHTTIEGRTVAPTLLGPQGGLEFLLRDPRVAMLVSALSPRRIVARGLRFEHCNVVAFLDPPPGGDEEAYRAALEVGLTAASDAVVISADNPHAEFVLERVEPARVLLVAARRRNPVVARHIAAKGAVVTPALGPALQAVELRRAGRTVATIPVGDIRRSRREPNDRAVHRILFTAALALGLDATAADRPRPRIADSAAETRRARAGSPGTRRASRQDGSYPSADGDRDGPYPNRR